MSNPTQVRTPRQARPRTRKPAPPVKAEWISRLGADGRGILLIGRGERLDPYLITEITSPLGDHTVAVGYRLEKPDGESYDIDLTGFAPECQCLGWLRHGPKVKCKHILALELAVLPEPERDGSGQCFPDVDVSDPETPF